MNGNAGPDAEGLLAEMDRSPECRQREHYYQAQDVDGRHREQEIVIIGADVWVRRR